MITLGVDTSTDSLAVSLIDGKKILADYNSAAALRHSALLVPAIEKALKRAGINIKNIDLFSIGIGPGSFTGLRVGITAVRALAIALDKPLMGVPTMDVIAHNGLMYLRRTKLPNGKVKICPVLDAKRKQVYACIYEHDDVNIIRKTDYLLEPVEKLVKRLKGPVLFLGDAASLYKTELQHKRSLKARFFNGKNWLPKASVVARLALVEYNKGRSDNPYDLVPLYLYARDCQVRKNK